MTARRIVNARFGPLDEPAETSIPLEPDEREVSRYANGTAAKKMAELLIKKERLRAEAARSERTAAGPVTPRHDGRGTPSGAVTLPMAMTGMALSYWEALAVLLADAAFLWRNIPTLAAGLMHATIPLFFAWTVSHWNDRIEETFFSGFPGEGVIGFACLWFVMFLAWGGAWCLTSHVFSKTGDTLRELGRIGESRSGSRAARS